MKVERTNLTRRAEAGIALLISIFILLLISVVAIALIVSSSTESALAGNYRSSTDVYYAALAGVEEARGRLSPKDPYAFKTTWTAFYPAPGTPLPIGTVGYVLNPGPTETAGTLLATYPDTEYDTEFGSGALAGATIVNPTMSVWNRNPLLTNLSFPGPLYKWVRINAVSEQSLKLADTFPFIDGTQDPTPLYYDGTHLTDTSTGSASQVFEITALAVLPNGSGQSSQKIVQYLSAPTPITLPQFLAALTLSGSTGNGATFQAPGSTNLAYSVKGNDQDCSGNPTGTNNRAAIGVFTNTDRANAIGGIPLAPGSIRLGYTGQSAAPDVEDIHSIYLPTPGQLDSIAQTIIQNADAVVPATGNAAQTAYLSTLGMSSSKLLTVVANGDLDVSNWSSTGYGLLLVTGTFTYDPDTRWNGIVLVIGKGIVNNSQNGQYKEINGAMFVAKTRDGLGNILGSLGGASMAFNTNMQGNGVRYSNCWIQKASPTGGYKILSFHEISQ